MTSEIERKTEAANKALEELNAEIEREIGKAFLNAAASQQPQQPPQAPQEQISCIGCFVLFAVTVAVIAVAGWWIWKQLF